MALPRLTKAAAQTIDRAVDDAFDALKLRFLGPTGDKRLVMGFLRERSLPGLFEDAVREEGGVPDLGLLDHLIAVTADYIEQHRSAAKANMKRRVQETLQNVKTGKLKPEDLRTTLDADLQQLWVSITAGVRKVVETESEHAKTLGVKDAIDQINARLGIEDPIICFIPVRDHLLCGECVRLHLFRDSAGHYIPRVWKTSEVKSEFHKKGDPTPSFSKLHPHCRCELTTVLPGFGFNGSGLLTYITEGHDEWARQRGLEERYVKRYGKLRKSTSAGLEIFNMLKGEWNNTTEPWKSHYWVDRSHRYMEERFRDYWRGRMNKYVDESTGGASAGHPWWDAIGKLDTDANWGPAEEHIQKTFPGYRPWDKKNRPHKNLVEAIQNAPITMNFPSHALEGFLKHGRYRNLFETGDGMGETDTETRADFERNVFGIHEDTKPEQRPIYGALNHNASISRRHEHGGGAPGYGDSWLELKPHVKNRATFTHEDSFSCSPDHVFTAEHPEPLAWFGARRSNPAWELHHEHGTTEDRDLGYIEAQVHGGVYFNNDVAAIHLGSNNGNANDWTPENLAGDKPTDRFGNQTHRAAVKLGKKHGIPVYLHLKTKSENNGPRPEYKVVTLYHPAFDASKPRKPRKQAVPKEQASLFKSTPAGLAVLNDLLPRYRANAEMMRNESGYFAMPQRVLRMYSQAPLAINLPEHALRRVLNEGRFKNLYETGEGGGNMNQDTRKFHEKRALGIIEDRAAHERPIYGALHQWYGQDPTLHMEAYGPAQQYGNLWVTLKSHVKERATITPHDSFGAAPEHVMHVSDMDAYLKRLVRGRHHYTSEDSLDYVQGINPESKHDPLFGGMNYHEVQIHGGIYPKDIEAIHVAPDRGGRAHDDKVGAAMLAGKRWRVPVYSYERENWEHPLTPEQQAGWDKYVSDSKALEEGIYGRTHSLDVTENKVKYTLGARGKKFVKKMLYHPEHDMSEQSPSETDKLYSRLKEEGFVEKSEFGSFGIPLFKAANWKLADFERLIGEFGWYPESESKHKLYAHSTIPYKLAVKHEHAHGALTPFWVKKYAKDIGLNITYTGQAMQADPKHQYAEHYKRMGHLPYDTQTAPAIKTYQPASEHHEVVELSKLKALRPATQPWKVLKYQASMGRNMKLHPITVSKTPDGDYAVVKGHHLLTAAHAAGLTHVPVRHA